MARYVNVLSTINPNCLRKLQLIFDIELPTEELPSDLDCGSVDPQGDMVRLEVLMSYRARVRRWIYRVQFRGFGRDVLL